MQPSTIICKLSFSEGKINVTKDISNVLDLRGIENATKDIKDELELRGIKNKCTKDIKDVLELRGIKILIFSAK